MAVALFTHPACLGHDNGRFHPESPDRLRAVLQALEQPVFTALLHERAPQATREQLARAHTPDYVDAILAIRPEPGERVQLDPDTSMMSGSADAALHAAGGAAAAVDAVMEGWVRAAFVAARPPGHHAEPARAMGFCLFNNAAVAAHHARARWGLRRIAVADFDAHHGNGIQAILESDPGLFYASSHQHPCYPDSGAAEEHGVANNVVNLLVPPGTDGPTLRRGWERVILPALDAFAPELLIVAAGFDAHRADPLAELLLETKDYAWLTDRLMEVAHSHADDRLVSVLEGGYDLAALAASVALHVHHLMRC